MDKIKYQVIDKRDDKVKATIYNDDKNFEYLKSSKFYKLKEVKNK